MRRYWVVAVLSGQVELVVVAVVVVVVAVVVVVVRQR